MALPVLQRTSIQEINNNQPDPRPRFGIGHVMLPANNAAVLMDFYTAVGMRLIVDMGRTAIVELRGGTHIVIHSGEGGSTSLDLIVDDIDETRAVMAAAGAEVSAITRGNPHDQFVATDPEGNTVVVNSNHAMGPV